MPPTPIPKREHLEIWYEFCCLVESRHWSNPRHPLRPRRGEVFEGWLERNRADFELTPTHGLVEHKTPQDFERHYIPGFYELHLSVNLYAPKPVIRREFNRLLNERQVHPGIKDAAGFRFNAPVSIRPLRKLIAVLRATREGMNDLEIATNVLRKNYKNSNTATAAISRDRKKALAILDAIPSGRFPNPELPAGDWSSGRPSSLMRHRLAK